MTISTASAGAKPAEQPVQTDVAQPDQGGLRDHQQHPAVKDRAMDAEQDHVSDWALGMQQTGSDGVAEAVGDERQHNDRHGEIESARCRCCGLRCVRCHGDGRRVNPSGFPSDCMARSVALHILAEEPCRPNYRIHLYSERLTLEGVAIIRTICRRRSGSFPRVDWQLALILCLSLLAPRGLVAESMMSGTLKVDGASRTYSLHTPTGYQSGTPTPLVLVFRNEGQPDPRGSLARCKKIAQIQFRSR